MKNLLFLVLALLISCGIVQGQEQVTASVDATVLAELSVTKNADIDFGNVSASSTPILDPTGASHVDVGTQFSVGEFALAGAAGSQLNIEYDASVTLGDGTSNTLTFTPAVAGHATTQGSATPVASGSQVTLDGSGDYILWVGGNLGTLSGQTPAVYSSGAANGSGDFTLTVEYY
jgi:hypothetical protein